MVGEGAAETVAQPLHLAPVRGRVEDAHPLEGRGLILRPAARGQPGVGIAARGSGQELRAGKIRADLRHIGAQMPEGIRPDVEFVEMPRRQRIAAVKPPPHGKVAVGHGAGMKLRQRPRRRHCRAHRKLRDAHPVAPEEKRGPRPARQHHPRRGDAALFRDHTRDRAARGVDRAHSALLDDGHAAPRQRRGQTRHRDPGLRPPVRRRQDTAAPARGVGDIGVDLSPPQHPRIKAMVARMDHPRLVARQRRRIIRRVKDARPAKPQIGPGRFGKPGPDLKRLDHDRQFRRIAALLADPAPVAARLFRRDAALFAQDNLFAARGQKPGGHHANHATADHDHIGLTRDRPREPGRMPRMERKHDP